MYIFVVIASVILLAMLFLICSISTLLMRSHKVMSILVAVGGACLWSGIVYLVLKLLGVEL